MTHAYRRYEDERRIEVLRLQSAARNSPNGSKTSSAISISISPVQLLIADAFAADQP